ncbi:MAG: helicase HerA-like domain-containing protein, partial [Fimbriimonadales bacterium]
NRHGLIAGATGTGKTVSLQVLAEGFSLIGVPVFMSDVKGDLTGLTTPGTANPKIDERLEKIGAEGFEFKSFPTEFWDPFGEKGLQVRATISEMGPLLLARMMNLNDTQEGVLNIAFRIADEDGLLLLDIKDLRAMLKWVDEHSEEINSEYGFVTSATIGTIQRGLLVLEEQGADQFFGERALDIRDLMRTDSNGLGIINILAANRLMQSPRLYAVFLLWLLSELFEELPEVGDPEKPKLVFFFDEAHLLFDEAPSALLDKINQVVRLIRSKGVGIYFITQNPIDIPESVLGQLGHKVQHALRAFTPREQKAVKAAAENFRENPNVDVEKTILEMGVGEALVSILDEKGTPTPVQRTLIRPPMSRIGIADPGIVESVRSQSRLIDMYKESIDRESAYEMLTEKSKIAAARERADAEKAEMDAQLAVEQTEREKAQRAMEKAQAAEDAREQKRLEREDASRAKESERRAREADRERKSWVNWGLKNVGGKVITQVLRGVLGGRRR